MALQHCGHVAHTSSPVAPCFVHLWAGTTRPAVRHATAEHKDQRWKTNCRGDRRAQTLVAKASDNSNSSSASSQQAPKATESVLGESDSAFFLKLLVISIAGAAAIKYGSLLLDTPFQPNLALGLSIIAAPCIVFAVYLGSKSR